MSLAKGLLKNKIFIIVIVLMLVMFPGVITRSAEGEMMALVAAMGIDVVEGGQLEVSVAIIQNKVTGGDVNANLFDHSDKGESLGQIIDKIGRELGRRLALSHCEEIIISESVLQDNSIRHLDFFIRTNNFTTNSNLFLTDASAKDVIKGKCMTENPFTEVMTNTLEYRDGTYEPMEMTIKNFFKDYYGNRSISVMGIVSVEKEGEGKSGSGGGSGASDNGGMSSSGSSSSGGGSSGGGGGGSGESKVKGLYINNQLAIVKEGKLVRKLSPEESSIYNIVNETSTNDILTIHNIDTAQFYNASITFEIYYKHVKTKVYFNNGNPVYNVHLKMHLKFSEINADFYTESSIDEISDFMYDNVYEAIELKLKSQFNELVENCKKDETDIFGVNETLYKFKTKQWNNFVTSLEDPDDYLNNVVFQMDMQIITKL